MIKKFSQLALILFLILSPLTSKAAGDSQMAIYPNTWDGSNELTKHWFVYDLGPGQSHEDEVVVENMGDSELSVKVYAVDALTTQDGAFALENEDESKDDIGDWVTLSENELVLAANEKRVIGFTITIPEEVSPGEHMGGIVIENRDVQEGELLNLKTRVGVRIYETVPGDVVNKIEIGEIDVEGYYPSVWSLFYDWKASYVVNNLGNVQANPEIDVLLTSSIFGDLINEKVETKGSIFPNNSIEPTLEINEKLYFGPHTLMLTVNQEGITTPIQKSLTFWVLPWKLGLLILVILLALWSFVYMRRGGRKEDENESGFIITGEGSEDVPRRKTAKTSKTTKSAKRKRKKK